MLHINWNGDVIQPDFRPVAGMGVFIDMPDNIKRLFAAQRVASADGSPLALSGAEREEMIEGVARSFEPGTPWLIRWP